MTVRLSLRVVGLLRGNGRVQNVTNHSRLTFQSCKTSKPPNTQNKASHIQTSHNIPASKKIVSDKMTISKALFVFLCASIPFVNCRAGISGNLRHRTTISTGQFSPEFTVLSATMGAYPDSPHPLTPSGEVVMAFNPRGDLGIFLDVENVAVNCTKSNNATNGCGIHIHAGTTCDNATQVLGHYWNESDTAEDPWVDARYGSDESGLSLSQVILPGGNGFDPSENIGHALVLHEKDGSRVSCGLLKLAAIF